MRTPPVGELACNEANQTHPHRTGVCVFVMCVCVWGGQGGCCRFEENHLQKQKSDHAQEAVGRPYVVTLCSECVWVCVCIHQTQRGCVVKCV